MKRSVACHCLVGLLAASAPATLACADGAPIFSEPFDASTSTRTIAGPGWVAALVDGPTEAEALTAAPRRGFTGLHALRVDVSGEIPGAILGRPRNRRIASDSMMRYMIFPVSDPQSLVDPATYASLDVTFTDGTRASDLGAHDLAGNVLTPVAQGSGRTLVPNQWNEVCVPLGDIAAGKTIRSIELRSAAPHEKPYRFYLDDIAIGSGDIPRRLTPADWVDTRRGTNANGRYSRGNTFPAVALPHGFNFWTPVTRGDSNWLYQYQERNDAANRPHLEALSLSHEPSPWMGDRQTFQIMPVPGDAPPSSDRKLRSASFDHARETALPYRYAVRLDDGILAEIAPTDHAAIMRFRFPGQAGALAFDNLDDHGHLTIAPDGRSADGYTDVASTLSTGATRMFVHLEFDRPARAQGRLTGQHRDDVAAWASFNVVDGKPLVVRIATSLISLDQARHALAMEIPTGTEFGTVAEQARSEWNSRLSTVTIADAPADEQRTLYGNLYRLFLYPNVADENTGTLAAPHVAHASPFLAHAGPDTPTQTGARIVDGRLFVNNGFWDTYRTAWPAYALLAPDEAATLIDGFVQQYREAGWIARWSSPGFADLMTGTSADAAFADSWRKGVHGFDVAAFYQAALKDATVPPDSPGVGRKDLARSQYRGYTDTGTDEGLSWSNAATLNDFAIGELASELAAKAAPATQPDLEAEAWYLHNRALDYANLFDRDVGFFVGRKPDGQWRATPANFDPLAWGGDYTETNAWTMAFDPVQDGNGLAALYGGRDGLARKLDAYFALPGLYRVGAYGEVIHEMREAHDVRMGQYSHSNQPAHHILYMYDTAGQPWKAQDKIRDAMNRLYRGSEIGQGYPGDEDNGEMSAWWIFSAAGFYPLRIGTPTYAIGAPRFETMRISTGHGHTLTIRAPGVSDRNRFIQSVHLDGVALTRWWLTQSQIKKSRELVFEMGPHPSAWGKSPDAALPSLTPSGQYPSPAVDLTKSTGAERAGPAAAFDDDSATIATIDAKGLTVHLPHADIALAYTLTSGDRRDAAPTGWELSASDDGMAWTVIDRRDSERFAWKQQLRPFLIHAPKPHRFYRWRPLGGQTVTLGEFELLGPLPK